MSQLLNRLCAVVVMLAVSSSGFAQEADLIAKSADCRPLYPKKNACQPKPQPCPCPEPEPCCFFEQGLALEDDFIPPCDVLYGAAYNAPAEINVDSCMDINVDASFIYWNFYQDAMDVTFVDSVAALTVQPQFIVPGTVVNQKTGYKPGFKVGVGWDTHFDNWSLNAEYTWFHHNQSTQANIGTSPVGFTMNEWFADLTTVFKFLSNDASSTWSMHMDMLDVVVGRPYYQGTHLTVSPTVGLRGLWIRQEMDILMHPRDRLGQFITTKSLNHSNSWAVGPKFGIGTQWIVWNGLRLDGVVGASLLYTRFTSLGRTLIALNTNSGDFFLHANSPAVSAICPTLDMGLGLGYGMYAFSNKFFFDLSVRYDFAQFWSQNAMRNYAAELIGTGGAVGDLNLHGLTVTLRCDF